ncbi:MAG: protein kinase [Acidobacteria bacterium]|nr:protein kinase [Acidobacteriota bacterium]
MNTENWKKIKEVFSGIVELSEEQRKDFLDGAFDVNDEMRLEIEKMLLFDNEQLDDEDDLEKSAFEHFSDVLRSNVPDAIGEYKIVREIGRGGMGAVYEAIRTGENFSQRVALKVIKRGMDTEAIISRFRHEQQILSSLEHPNIARFLNGGMTDDNLPFYAMEFVEGEFIDEYCRNRNLNIDERLKLFRKVCEAVQFAHQNLIIHRDLKPKNILVTEDGTPKLLDFGIGKILSPGSFEAVGTATQFGMMTPDYASPEQIRGAQIGTPSDIYSLGVVLYQLLTGEKPYRANSGNDFELQKAILETAPTKPSAVNSSKVGAERSISLPKDIDRIILKAMHKEPAGRYKSVQESSEDIRRHRAGLPVYARPLTWKYRGGKFIRRNKASVIAGALVFLSLAAGITVAVRQTLEAREAERIAQNRFEDVRNLANNVVFKYHDAIADLPGSTEVRKMLVSDALEYLDRLAKNSSDNSELQKELARAYLKMGDVQGEMYAANIGDTKGALASYKKAVDLLEAAVKKNPEDIAAKEILITAYDSYAFLGLRTSSPGDLKEIVNKAIVLQGEITRSRPMNDSDTARLIELYIRLGDVDVGDRAKEGQDFGIRLAHHMKALPLAEALYRSRGDSAANTKTLARVYQRIGTDHISLAEEAEANGDLALSKEQYARSLEFHKKSFEMIEKIYQSDPESNESRRYMESGFAIMSKSLSAVGKYEEALEYAIRNLKLSKEVFERDPADKEGEFSVSLAYGVLADVYARKDEYRKSIENTEKALAIDKKIYRADKNNREALIRIGSHHKKLSELFLLIKNENEARFHSAKQREYHDLINLSRN